MDGPALEQKAANYLLTQNVENVLPGFLSWRSIMSAQRMKLHVVADGAQLARVLGGMTIHSLENLGHLVSKTAWKLQETGQDSDVLNQNDLAYRQHRFPLVTESVHVIGEAHRTAHLTQHLSFTIFVHVSGRKVLIGMGSSSLEVVPDGLVELGPNGDMIAPLQPMNIEIRPAQALQAASSAPPSPTCSILAPTDAPPPSPWPLSPIGSPSHEASSSQQNEVRGVFTFMLVNVTESNTTKNEIFMEKLREMGVNPETFNSEPLPIKPLHRRVYFFDVTNEDDVRKIEALIMPKEWPTKFAIHALQAEEPFFWTALTITDIIKALILSQKMNKNGETVSAELQLEDVLRDKRHILDILQDDEVVKKVIGGLNRTGQCIFKQEIKPQASD